MTETSKSAATGKSEISELLEVSREILKWIKFANFDKVKSMLEKILSDDDRKLVYHLSNGINTSRTIASSTLVSHNTVASWWKVWSNVGIVDNISVQRGGRGKKVFNLEDFDIPIPKIPETKAEEKPE